MKPVFLLVGLLALAACGQQETRNESPALREVGTTTNSTLSATQTDTTIQFLWRGMKYDSSFNDSVNALFLHQEYIAAIPEPQKAALGYVATFIGNECWWDGEANDDRSNLDCKILTALGLGYQCSDTHLGFLRKWFATDKHVLSELEKSTCPTTPYTATVQDTFDEITLTTKGDSIIVSYKASAINGRTQESWKWSETAYFVINNQSLRLIRKDTSTVDYSSFETAEAQNSD